MSYSGLNKNVFDKLPKQEVELSSDKVELGIKQDAESAYKDAIAKRKAANDSYQTIFTTIKTILGDLAAAEKASNDAIGVLDKYAAAVKDLGLELPADIKNQKQNLQDGLKGTLSVYKKKLESFK